VQGETATVLRFEGDGFPALSLWYRCGQLTGSWRADTNGVFVGLIDGVSRCPDPKSDFTPAWLRGVTAFRATGDGRVLLDAGGGIVTRLLPVGRPAPAPPLGVDPKSVRPPVVTDEARRRLAPAAPLPPALTAVARDALVGRWVPLPDQKSRKPFAELRADGSWTSFDGCNGQFGRWAAGPAGALLAIGGHMTLLDCGNHPVGDWFQEASRAGIDGDTLVLLDRGGTELGRVRRG